MNGAISNGSPMADDVVEWVAWEPPEYVEARGPSLCVESAHFCVRYGASGAGSERAGRGIGSNSRASPAPHWQEALVRRAAECARDVDGTPDLDGAGWPWLHSNYP